MVGDDRAVAPSRLDADAAGEVRRVALDAAARPARAGRIDPTLVPAAPRSAVLAASFAGVRSTVAVVRGDAVARHVIRGVRALLVDDPSAADVVVAPRGIAAVLLTTLRRGSVSSPAGGARLFVDADGVRTVAPGGTPPDPDATELWLVGPGAARGRRCAIRGVGADWFDELARVNAEPPMGVDTWIVDPTGALVAIPRSVSIHVVAHPDDLPGMRRSRRR